MAITALASRLYLLRILDMESSFVTIRRKSHLWATGPGTGLLQALRLLEVLWIMSAMPLLSCVPRFLSLSALAIRTRSVAV